MWSNFSTPTGPCIPLTKVFEDAGYRTASFGKNHETTGGIPAFQTEVDLILSDGVGYFGYADQWNPEEFDVVQYPGMPCAWVLAGRFPGHPGETAEAKVVAAAKGWLQELPADVPFLLRVSLNGPHAPVVPPSPFDTCIDPGDISLPGRQHLPLDAPAWLHDLAKIASADRLSDLDVQRMRQAYYSEVAYLDQLVGDLLSWMSGHALLDNLIIAFCSDHGRHLGDFGLVQKQTFFEPVVNVPYFFWGPGRVEARDPVNTPVEVRTVLPTLLELSGLDLPSACQTPSLAPVLTRRSVDPSGSTVFSEFTLGSFEIRPHDRLVMAREGPWKLSVCLDPAPHDVLLVNVEQNPDECVNRVTDPAAAPVREQLLERVIAHVAGE